MAQRIKLYAQVALLTMVVIVAVIFGTGCAATTRGGNTFYFGGSPEAVTATNNTPYAGDLYRNGQYFVTLPSGQTTQVSFGLVGPNMLLTFKAFVAEEGGKKYLGMSEQTFSPSGYIGYHQSWPITYVQPPRRSF